MKRVKTLQTLVLSGAFLFGGCEKYNNLQQMEKSEQPSYEFNNFGIIGTIETNFERPISAVSSADLDGDGDYDLIIASTGGSIYILENKMIKKNKGVK